MLKMASTARGIFHLVFRMWIMCPKFKPVPRNEFTCNRIINVDLRWLLENSYHWVSICSDIKRGTNNHKHVYPKSWNKIYLMWLLKNFMSQFQFSPSVLWSHNQSWVCVVFIFIILVVGCLTNTKQIRSTCVKYDCSSIP